MAVKNHFLRKLLAILLIGTSYWIIVSEGKAVIVEIFGITSRFILVVIALVLLFIAYKTLGSWFKF